MWNRRISVPAQAAPNREAIHQAAKNGNLQYWRDSEAQRLAFDEWRLGGYVGDCPQLAKGSIVDYITDAVVAALPAPVQSCSAGNDVAAWMSFAWNGNIRFWTAVPDRAAAEKRQGMDLRAFTLPELIALISRMPVLPQTSWQPIETAPKDGTLVLICGFGSEGYFVADAKWDGEWLLFHPDNDDHTEPSYNVSYWMPLPAPPSEVSRPQRATPSAADTSAPGQFRNG
jgi:hypothetical protein